MTSIVIETQHMKKPVILFVTDLYYPAKGRNYYEEDLFLTSELRKYFDLAMCHPTQTEPFENSVELIMIRNSGPTLYYKDVFNTFVKRIENLKKPTYNALSGKADIRGKQYLIDLTKQEFPVIPTIDDVRHLDCLPRTSRFVVKPKDGADSVGIKFVTSRELQEQEWNGYLIQPAMDIKYEISFYFIDKEFQYALHAPDKQRRWELKNYEPTKEDLHFAQIFIEWNDLSHGIQRVDACRTEVDDVLLVELEDLNPYLSLSVLNEAQREAFIAKLIISMKQVI